MALNFRGSAVLSLDIFWMGDLMLYLLSTPTKCQPTKCCCSRGHSISASRWDQKPTNWQRAYPWPADCWWRDSSSSGRRCHSSFWRWPLSIRKLCNRHNFRLPREIKIVYWWTRCCVLLRPAKPIVFLAKVISFMFENYEDYQHIDVEIIINVDVPPQILYNSMDDCIAAMAEPTSLLGEIEITATTKVLWKRIVVMNANNEVIQTYGEDIFPSLIVQFINIGQDVGHYNCILSRKVNQREDITSRDPRCLLIIISTGNCFSYPSLADTSYPST